MTLTVCGGGGGWSSECVWHLTLSSFSQLSIAHPNIGSVGSEKGWDFPPAIGKIPSGMTTTMTITPGKLLTTIYTCANGTKNKEQKLMKKG